MIRNRSFWVVALVCAISAFAAFFFLHRGEHEQQEKATTASVVSVTRGDLASKLTVAGQFQPYQDVDLHAKVSGYIRQISVDIGDRVHQGQILAKLEVPELDDQVQGAQAEVRHSQSQIGRAQSEVVSAESTHAALHAAFTRLEQAAKQQPGLIAEQELDDARAKDLESQAQIDVAKAALESARQQLGISQANSHRYKTLSDYSYIIAPFTGVVTMRYADTGSLIQAGTSSNTQSMPVVRLAQSDLLRLRMPVPETDVPYIAIGGTVAVHVQATGRDFTGKIIRFSRDLNSATRTMVTEVDVQNPDLILSPGMYAETSIQLQQKKNALTVPSQAVVQNGDQVYVLVVNKQNRVEKRNVTLGIQTANRSELTGGVQEGDSIIAAGQANYQVGQLVQPRPAFIPTDKQEVGE
jgi:RND family efflux transporter MFP subunit